MQRETPLPTKGVSRRKRYARLPKHEYVEQCRGVWMGHCDTHWALLCLDSEVRAGGFLIMGTWHGHHYAALLAHDADQRPGPNAVSEWGAASPMTALKGLAFKWSERMRYSWDPERWGIPQVDFEMRMPVPGEDLWNV